MLNTSYYMSSLSSSVLGILKNNFFWVDALSNTPAFASEQRQMAADRLTKIAADMTGLDKVHGRASSARSDGPDSEGKSPLSKLAQGGCSSAVEGCQHCCQQMAKLALFGNPNLLASQRRAKLSAEASAAGASLST